MGKRQDNTSDQAVLLNQLEDSLFRLEEEMARRRGLQFQSTEDAAQAHLLRKQIRLVGILKSSRTKH